MCSFHFTLSILRRDSFFEFGHSANKGRENFRESIAFQWAKYDNFFTTAWCLNFAPLELTTEFLESLLTKARLTASKSSRMTDIVTALSIAKKDSSG